MCTFKSAPRRGNYPSARTPPARLGGEPDVRAFMGTSASGGVGGLGNDDVMEALVIAWAQPIVVAIVTGGIGYRLGARQERAKERRARPLIAAGEVAAALRNLQVVLHRHGRDAMLSDEVSAAFIAWATACDSHGHRLTAGYRHIARSVRDAAGTVFGGSSLVHLRPDTTLLGLADPHAMWQDYADDYLDYLARHLLRWGDSEGQRPRLS